MLTDEKNIKSESVLHVMSILPFLKTCAADKQFSFARTYDKIATKVFFFEMKKSALVTFHGRLDGKLLCFVALILATTFLLRFILLTKMSKDAQNCDYTNNKTVNSE